jgi:hypothetical protein
VDSWASPFGLFDIELAVDEFLRDPALRAMQPAGKPSF